MAHLLLRRSPCASAAAARRAAAAASISRSAAAGRIQHRGVSYILGIETSCDDTAAAVLDGDGNVLSNVISSQWELNAKWKGIVPALAARAHEENLPHVISAAIEQSGLKSVSELSAIAVTAGPGLSPCLDVGLIAARDLCVEHPSVDYLQINHLEAHVLVSRLPQESVARPEFPFVVLLVSGGHCCLVLAKDIGDYELLGNTLDDSVGEAFDKVARMLDITSDKGVHGGRLIEEMASRGNDRAFAFPEPMKHRKAGLCELCIDFRNNRLLSLTSDCDFSYSGLKTAMLREVKKLGELDEKTKEDLCASFQRRAVGQLLTRAQRACQWGKERLRGENISSIVVCGGVASNQYLRLQMEQVAAEEGVRAIFPPAKYCTDNGVMIAWAGLERHRRGMRSDPTTARYTPRWPLETLEPL